MKKLVVWYRPNTNDYTYKTYFDISNKYYVGYKNQYNHEVIIVIDIYKDLIHKTPIRIKVIRRLIRFLQKLDNERR